MSSDNWVTIRISELVVSGVDNKRIVITEDNFGKRVASNNTIGEASIWKAPEKNRNFDIFLFNTSNNAPYDPHLKDTM